jgi:hypothetical protein
LEGVFVVEPFPAKSAKPTAVRRSQRLLLTIRVLISGKQVSGLPFSEDALTQVVNAHGALILMKHLVSTGDRLQIRNIKTGEEVACTVVGIGERQDHKCGVGIEFDQPHPRFWRVSFPPDDWSPRSPEARKPSVHPRPAPK